MDSDMTFELAGGPYAVTAARLALADLDTHLNESVAFDEEQAPARVGVVRRRVDRRIARSRIQGHQVSSVTRAEPDEAAAHAPVTIPV